VQVNETLSLVIQPAGNGTGHILYGVFPKAGFFAPFVDIPVEFDLAYGCGNAYLFDYGDRHLATKGAHWRNGKPTDVQRDLFRQLRDKVRDICSGSISFAEPGAKKGEYGAAIAALTSEMILLSGRRIESEEARQFIKENLYQRVAGEQAIAVTIDGHVDATIEAALKRTIAAFSQAKEGGFFDYLKRILLENEIILRGNCVKIRHVRFPRRTTEKQLDAVRDRIQKEIRLYVPEAEVTFVQFCVLETGDDKIRNSIGCLAGE
jgi:hypothetical protein